MSRLTIQSAETDYQQTLDVGGTDRVADLRSLIAQQADVSRDRVTLVDAGRRLKDIQLLTSLRPAGPIVAVFEPPETFQLFLQFHRTTVVEIAKTAYVYDLMRELDRRRILPFGRMRLTSQGKELETTRRLCDYPLEEASTVFVNATLDWREHPEPVKNPWTGRSEYVVGLYGKIE